MKSKELHDDPALELSMIMSPFNEFFTWKTTPIAELIEVTDTKVHFKTGSGSEYLLLKGDMELFKSEEYIKIIDNFHNG